MEHCVPLHSAVMLSSAEHSAGPEPASAPNQCSELIKWACNNNTLAILFICAGSAAITYFDPFENNRPHTVIDLTQGEAIVNAHQRIDGRVEVEEGMVNYSLMNPRYFESGTRIDVLHDYDANILQFSAHLPTDRPRKEEVIDGIKVAAKFGLQVQSQVEEWVIEEKNPYHIVGRATIHPKTEYILCPQRK